MTGRFFFLDNLDFDEITGNDADALNTPTLQYYTDSKVFNIVELVMEGIKVCTNVCI